MCKITNTNNTNWMIITIICTVFTAKRASDGGNDDTGEQGNTWGLGQGSR